MANVGASADDDEPVVELQMEASERERFIAQLAPAWDGWRQRRFTAASAAQL